MPNLETFLKQYGFLISIYCKDVDATILGYTREDVKQLLLIKLWKSYEAYQRKQDLYEQTGLARHKPTPVLVYLRTAMRNRILDLVRQCARRQEHISFSKVEVDRGFIDGPVFLDVPTKGMTPIEKVTLKMVLRGYDLNEINEKLNQPCPQETFDKIESLIRSSIEQESAAFKTTTFISAN